MESRTAGGSSANVEQRTARVLRTQMRTERLWDVPALPRAQTLRKANKLLPCGQMQIDRAKFLALTTTIAAGHMACTPEPQPVAPAAMLMATAPPLGGAGSAPSTTAAPVEHQAAAANPEAERAELVARLRAQTLAAQADANAAAILAAMPPVACPLTSGSIGDCSTLRAPGPSCEGFDDLKDTCANFKAALQPRAAQKAVACMLGKSGTRALCDSRMASRCVLAALSATCADPAVETACATIAANCGQGRVPLGGGPMITKPACVQALSAVSGSNRDGVRSCMSEECSLNSCFFGLNAP